MTESHNAVNGRKVETMCNDRTKQFAIRIHPSDECPFTECLFLPAMETDEYLEAKAAGVKYRENLRTHLFDWHYDEIIINGDIRDVASKPPLGYSLLCTGWTGIGNQCGIVEQAQREIVL